MSTASNLHEQRRPKGELTRSQCSSFIAHSAGSNQAVDEAMRGPLKGKGSRQKKNNCAAPYTFRRTAGRRCIRPKGDIGMCYNCGCGMPNNILHVPNNAVTRRRTRQRREIEIDKELFSN
jgi:hypothetical protein